jgi:spermidine/putrescine transport system permease protein
MTLSKHHLAIPAAVVLVIGAVLPILLLVMFSVFRVEDLDLVPALSLRSWTDVVTSGTYRFLIGKAVVSGIVTVLLCIPVAYPLALCLTRLDARWKGIGLIVLLTPLYTGEIVRIYAWRIVLGSEGLVNATLKALGIIDQPLKILLFSPVATHLVLAYDNLPFMTLAIWVSVEFVDRRLIEAARDLGARPMQAFARVWLPLTAPGLAAGTFATFSLAAGDMLTPTLLGGTSGATAMAMIDNLFGTAFDWPTASALALTLLGVLNVGAVLIALAVLRLGRLRAGVSA